MIALISVLTFILLARAFRSLILPLKAVLLNLLSVAAAWGLIVLVWQKGFGSDERSGASRRRRRSTSRCRSSSSPSSSASRWTTRSSSSAGCGRRTTAPGSTETAVVEGIGRTGRLVTSAALILGLAFVAFGAQPGTEAKIFAPRSAAGS